MLTRRILTAVFVAAALGGCVMEMGDENESEIEQGVLAPPTTVTVTPTGGDRATVSWDAVTGAVKYYVYQQSGMTGPLTFIGTTRAPNTTFGVAHLQSGMQYCFAVRTEDGTGPGPFSTTTCGTAPDAPAAPNSVVATQETASSVRVDWQAVSGATKYYVYRSGALNGTYSYLTSVLAPNTTLINTNLTLETTYCYKVATVSPNGTSALSAGHCNTSLQPPTNVTATKTATGRIRIDWTQATGAFKYYIWESRAAGPLANVGSVLQSSIPTFTRANLTAGVEYCYQIQAVTSTNVPSPLSMPSTCATP